MNNNEFSDQFDVLLNSYKLKEEFGNAESIQLIKLDEYEKSVFLTKAQQDLIVELYSGRNQIGNSYEQTEELRRYLSVLNKTSLINTFQNMNNTGLSDTSIKCSISDDVLFITQEQCQIESDDLCLNNKWINTFPILRDEYNNIKDNPFKNKKVWRVDLENNNIELISNFIIKNYKISYIRKPRPIVLDNFISVSIEGINTITECELPSILHTSILEKAVISAISFSLSQNNNQNNK